MYSKFNKYSIINVKNVQLMKKMVFYLLKVSTFSELILIKES